MGLTRCYKTEVFLHFIDKETDRNDGCRHVDSRLFLHSVLQCAAWCPFSWQDRQRNCSLQTCSCSISNTAVFVVLLAWSGGQHSVQ